MDREDLTAFLEFLKKLESWILLIMTVGNFLVAAIILLTLLKMVWAQLTV